MKKMIIILAIVLIGILAYYTFAQGLIIGPYKVLGIQGVQAESNALSEKIIEASKLTSSEYPKQISDLTDVAQELLTQRSNYESLVNISTDSEVEQAIQSKRYEIEFLWGKIGTHATAEGVTLKFEVIKNSAGEDIYDLKFAATGSYVGITDFIQDLEDDDKLNFRIENFKLVPATITTVLVDNTNPNMPNTNTPQTTTAETTDVLQATFVVKGIAINIPNVAVPGTPDQPANPNAEGTQEPNTPDVPTDTNSQNTNTTDTTTAQ